MRTFCRAAILFCFGVLFYYVFGVLQGFRTGIFNDKFSVYIVSSNSGIPFFCGLLAVGCGLLSPHLCTRLKLPNAYEPEWSSITRCLVFFVGISHATAKIDFISLLQLICTSFSFAMGIWWLFDRSLGGMFLGTLMSLLGTGACFILGNHPAIKSADPLLFSWFPCIFFSAGITLCCVGRQLAKSESVESFKMKIE